jgi:hypothetical protein
LYIRAVRRSRWVALERSDASAIEEASRELVSRGSAVSVFECSSAGEAELVAVALSAGRRHPADLFYIELEADDLSAIGVRVEPTPGATRIPDADALHRDLDLSGDAARRLVERLAARRVSIRTVRARELRAIARRLRDAGQPIPPESWLLR